MSHRNEGANRLELDPCRRRDQRWLRAGVGEAERNCVERRQQVERVVVGHRGCYILPAAILATAMTSSWRSRAGVVTEYGTGIGAHQRAKVIVAGPDGNVWFAS